MRRLARIVGALSLALIVTVGTAAVQPDSAQAKGNPGKLHATASQPFVGAEGPVRLNGPNVQPVWAPDSTDTWGQGTYDSIRAKGFTAVRFVLHWNYFEPERGAWNETAFSTLTVALERARQASLYVVLDCIHLVGEAEGQANVPAWARAEDGMAAATANGAGFLRQLAGRYGGEYTVAAYDPVNEPYRWPMDHASVLADYTKIVNVIREIDPATNIIIEPTYGDARVPDAAFGAFTPADRANLIWSIHDYYVGGEGDGYRPDGLSQTDNASNGTTGYDPAHRGDLAAHVQVQVDTAARAGMPLWIGEFGIGATAPGHDQFIRDKVAVYRAHGLDYSWWEYYTRGAFSMIDEAGQWLPWVELLR